MPDFTKRVRKRLDLPDGEIVERAAVAQPRGSISRGVSEQGTGARGLVAALADKRRHDADGDTLAGRLPPRNGYLVVTNRRFLWADQTGTGSAGEILHTYEHGDVVSIVETEGGRMGNQVLAVRFVDDSSIELAVHRGQKPERLVEAVRVRSTGKPPDPASRRRRS